MPKKDKQKTIPVSHSKREPLSLSVKQFVDDYLYRIDLDADYQREKVWSKNDQEKLLDSMLRDIDIPKIYLAKVSGNKQFDFECIDGKQRMLTLLNFFKPNQDEKNPLSAEVFNKKYTYKQLRKEHPKHAEQIENFQLDFVIYEQASLSDEFIREIFRRLQLGIRLNSGETLNAQTGAIRDFIYKENGVTAPFLRNTNLSDKRFSRQFTLAQICINSFKHKEIDDFVRARLVDIEEFFADNHDIEKKDENLIRIREILKLMDEGFRNDAKNISSRAVAVSAYLFVEDLYLNAKTNLIPEFVKFYSKLLNEIKNDMKLLSRFEKPENPKLLEGFQKYILQASVEPYAIRRRDKFLKEAFEFYLDPKTKGKIIGSKTSKYSSKQ